MTVFSQKLDLDILFQGENEKDRAWIFRKITISLILWKSKSKYTKKWPFYLYRKIYLLDFCDFLLENHEYLKSTDVFSVFSEWTSEAIF